MSAQAEAVSFMAPQEGQRDRAGDKAALRTTATCLHTRCGCEGRLNMVAREAGRDSLEEGGQLLFQIINNER